MWKTLDVIGTPQSWFNVITRFYHDNLQTAGKHGVNKFIASTGIRQCCPLSRLLFAVVANILLPILKKRMFDQSCI